MNRSISPLFFCQPHLLGTFGFPFDLIQIQAQERGLKVESETFKQFMDDQREREKAV
jgi:alanyl-tRNA synthetase